MTRLYGRARKGERLLAPVPHRHWKTTAFTAELRLGGLVASMVLDGSLNGDAFRAYVEQILVPELNKGDVVTMDNLPANKVGAIRTMSEYAGVRLLYRASLSASLQPHRNGLFQTQCHAQKSLCEDYQRAMAGHRRRHREIPGQRLPKLLRQKKYNLD